MAVVALMLPDAAASARFGSALDDRDRVILAPAWRDLLRLVMRRPVDVCVLDPYDPFRPISYCQLQRFRRKHPDLAIIIYSDFHGRESELFDLGRLHIDGVVQATGLERRAAIRDTVDRALARAVAARVTRALEGRLPPFALEALGWAVEHAEDAPRVGHLCAATGTSPKALGRRLRDQDLPSPRQLLVWGRVLQATRILESTGVTVDGAAFRVGYSTGGALRRAFKRLTGLPPLEVMGAGGVSAVLESFLRFVTRPELDAATERRQRRRRHWARLP